MNAMTKIKSYLDVSVESHVNSADAHRLILLLYQGALLSIASARNSMLRKDVAAKGKSISQAISIIDEGLKASLNREVGGELAQNLLALYEYMSLRLLHANLHNDPMVLDEVSGLLMELRGAWESIGKPPVTVVPVVEPAPRTPADALTRLYGGQPVPRVYERA